MTKRKQSLVSDSTQLSLLDLLLQDREEQQFRRPARLAISSKIDSAIRQGIKSAQKSRETIADEMSELTGEMITAAMINNWTAISHPHEMPGRFYPAFCVATGDIDLIRIQAEAAGVFTLPGPDALRAEIQKLDEQTQKLRTEKRKRQMLLQELECKR